MVAGAQPEREAYKPAVVVQQELELNIPAAVRPLQAEAHTPAEVPQLEVAAHMRVETRVMAAEAHTRVAEAPGEEHRTAVVQPPEVSPVQVEPLERLQELLQENRKIRRSVHHLEFVYRSERRTNQHPLVQRTFRITYDILIGTKIL